MTMLGSCEVAPTIPTRDLARARSFYEETLGLDVASSDAGGVTYGVGSGGLYVYESEYAGTAQHTLCTFQSEHVDEEIDELRSRGVRFQSFDMAGVSWDGDVATMDDTRGVWFTDPDGNILGLFERSRVPAGV